MHTHKGNETEISIMSANATIKLHSQLSPYKLKAKQLSHDIRDRFEII